MLCSFLLPSRGRPDGLLAAIRSINDTATRLDSVELLVKFDKDDDVSLSRMAELKDAANFRVRFIVHDRLGGYVHLHIFVSQMAEMSMGRWLWLFNDDATVGTKGWDDRLWSLDKTVDDKRLLDMAVVRCSYPYLGAEVAVHNIKYNENNVFPIVSRRFYELLGHYSRTMYNDHYVDLVSKTAGSSIVCGWDPVAKVIRDPEIIVQHTMVHDKVRKDSEIQYTWKLPPDEQAAVDAGFQDDVRKVKEYLGK